MIPLLKIGDFLQAGFKFKFLIANLHAHLDDQKSPWSLLNARSVYYQEIIQSVLDALKIDSTRLMFTRGSDFQTKKDYSLDVLRISIIPKGNLLTTVRYPSFTSCLVTFRYVSVETKTS